MRIALNTFILLVCFLVGCDEQGPNRDLPIVQMRVGSQTFALEVADTDEAREIGLMHRDSMPKDHGMIFMFDESQIRGFWMKNTKIPLDIIFVSSDGRIVSIHQMEPYDINTTSSDYPARYAIELNQGAAQDAGAKVGDVLQIPSRSSATRPATTQSR